MAIQKKVRNSGTRPSKGKQPPEVDAGLPHFAADGDLPSDVAASEVTLSTTEALPDIVDLFLDGRQERIRGEHSAIPHFTLVIGARAVRGVEWKSKWYIEPMARRSFMFSDVHNIPWTRKAADEAIGKTFKVDDLIVIVGDGLSAVVGPSGAGKTMLLSVVAVQHRDDGGHVSFVNVGEPVPESETDTATILLALADALVNKRGGVLLIDSFKSALFTTPGNAGKGGISRPFFQDLSDLSTIMARYRIAGIGSVNYLTKDVDAAKEVTEALIGSTIGVFEVVSSVTASREEISYRYYRRDYLTGERPVLSLSLKRPEFTAQSRADGTRSVSIEEVQNAVIAAFHEAPSLESQVIPGKSIVRSLINRN